MKIARSRTGVLATLASLPLLALPSAVCAEEEEALQRHPVRRVADGAFDAVVLRPTGLVVLACGTALFAPAAVLTAPGGRDPLGHALDEFVLIPGRWVFTRPIGEF